MYNKNFTVNKKSKNIDKVGTVHFVSAFNVNIIESLINITQVIYFLF